MNDEQRSELDRIAEENNGMLIPAKVVEFAADKKTALHSHFTWNDREAAAKHRENEARALIRVYVAFLPAVQRTTRAFISVPSDRANGDGYRRAEDVISNPMLLNQMVDEVRKKISNLAESYAYLKFLDGLWPRLSSEIERFLAEASSKDVA